MDYRAFGFLGFWLQVFRALGLLVPVFCVTFALGLVLIKFGTYSKTFMSTSCTVQQRLILSGLVRGWCGEVQWGGFYFVQALALAELWQ